MEIPVIYVFTHDSIGVGEDGPTHQPVEQLLSLRAIPGLVTIRPADANEVTEAWRTTLQFRHQPVALVLSRQALPTLDRTKYSAAAGLAKGAYVLADPPTGSPRCCCIATGSEVALCVAAHEQLAKEGIKEPGREPALVGAVRRAAPGVQRAAFCRPRSGPGCPSSRPRSSAGSTTSGRPAAPSACVPSALPPRSRICRRSSASIPRTWWRRPRSSSRERPEYADHAGDVLTQELADTLRKQRHEVLYAGLARRHSDYPRPGEKCHEQSDIPSVVGAERRRCAGSLRPVRMARLHSAQPDRRGELKRLVREDGLGGVTSNPAIFEKAIDGSNDYKSAIEELSQATPGCRPRRSSSSWRSRTSRTPPTCCGSSTTGRRHVDGYVSLEVAPDLANDTEETVEEARRLWTAGRPAERHDQGARRRRRACPAIAHADQRRHQRQRHAAVRA